MLLTSITLVKLSAEVMLGDVIIVVVIVVIESIIPVVVIPISRYPDTISI